MRTAVRFFFSLLVLTCAWASVALAAPGEQEIGEIVDVPLPTECHDPRNLVAPDGSRRQTFDAFNPSTGIAALPPRTQTELRPGQSGTYCVGFQNRGADPIDLKVDVVDVAADKNGLPSSQRDAVDRGASRWVRLIVTKVDDLKPGDVAWLTVRVSVPEDAGAGSSYASVLATDTTPLPSGPGTQVQSIPSVASQLFFDIPGDATRRGTITNIRSPRVIWWDGLDLGGLPVLERMRGLGVGTVRFTWENSGDYTSDIGGEVAISSDLSDKTVTRLDVPARVVLRRSERDFAVTWSRDIPLVGRFTPVLEVRGESGRAERHELDPIWVIPAWWYILLLLAAIAVPLWWRRRSQVRYRNLLSRVEAAESRSGGELDEDAWDSDDWPEGR